MPAPTSPLPRRRAAALLLPLLLAACGGDADETAAGDAAAPPLAEAAAPPAAPAAGPQDPCTLIDPGNVSAATGLGPVTGQPSTSGGAAVCTWTDAEGKSAIAQVFPSADGYQQSRQAFESLYGATAEELEGIADQAYYIGGTTGPVPTATVGALKGQTAASFQVMAMNADTTDLRSAALELAQRTLQQM
jgi:hypothetical protein